MRYVGFERLFSDKIIRNEKYNKMKKLEQIRLQQIRKGVKCNEIQELEKLETERDAIAERVAKKIKFN